MARGALQRSAELRQRLVSRRGLLLGAAQIAGFGLLASRMYQLQIIEAEQYQTLSDNNRINLRFEVPTRGLILDRDGRLLAANKTAYRVAVVPEQTGGFEALLGRLHRIVPIDPGDWEDAVQTAGRQPGFVPVVVYRKLAWRDVAKISVRMVDLPGVEVSVAKQRLYPEGAFGAHIVGYVGPVSRKELTSDPVMSLPDFRIGKTGIERIYDQELRGQAGQRQVEVNAVGRTIRELANAPEVPGAPLQLTLDSRLQRIAANRFGSETGAAVVMDARHGEILAMVSQPSFDPFLFSGGISHADWQSLIQNPDSPLVNKAIAGQYAPGSTFKMVTALAALEAELVTEGTQFFCPGVLEVGKGKFHCWHRGGHGKVNLHSAIVESCDVYFYEVARRVGIERIAAMARRLGFGTPTGIDLPGEKSGLIPDKDWKVQRYGRPWQIGESLIAAIGQGYVLATPLQLAVMTARLVNGGLAVEPRMQAAEKDAPKAVDLGISRASLAAVVQAMIGVTTEANGTARASQLHAQDMWMGGKTGTSQVRRITARERRLGVLRNQERPRAHRDHALFVGFAPLESPDFVVSVIVEHGGGGSKAAAPVARDLLLEAQLLHRGRSS